MVSIDIDLAYFELISVLAGYFLKNGRDHFAWAAPFCPIIYQYRLVGFKHILVKAVISCVNDVVAHNLVSSDEKAVYHI